MRNGNTTVHPIGPRKLAAYAKYKLATIEFNTTLDTLRAVATNG